MMIKHRRATILHRDQLAQGLHPELESKDNFINSLMKGNFAGSAYLFAYYFLSIEFPLCSKYLIFYRVISYAGEGPL